MINSSNANNGPVVTRSNSSGNGNAKEASHTKPHTYRVIKLIGEGAFGKAYLVECNSDKSLCVIKTINIDSMSDQEKKETLLEAKILEKLDHSNIIGFKEVFLAKKPTFTLNIVTDYADGGDLNSKIKGQKGKHFSENQILDWFTQICLALKHIHDKKILHRDLKSQNIFMTENGMIKLGDFGIAKCLEYTWQKAMTVVGTPYYLSPEIVNNKPYSFKSDIWSLGVLLYEMAALKMPFDATSLPLLSLKIIKGQYTPLPSHFSKDLKNLVSMLLVVDQVRRPTINQILKLPLIKSRIKSFLSEIEYNQEFSHTIIHNYNVLKDNSVKPRRNHSSSVDTQSTSANTQSNKETEESGHNKHISPSPGKESGDGNGNNNINVKNNHGFVIHCKPQIIKREMDNKEIVDFMKKNERKKSKDVKEIRRPSNSRLGNGINSNVKNINNPDIKHIDINSNIKEQEKEDVVVVNNVVNNKDKKLLDTQFEANPLKELMKRAKAADEKEFHPKIVEKPVESKESHVINVKVNNQTPHQHAVINNKIQNKKEAEEIYNLNRYLNELAKLEDGEDEPVGDEGDDLERAQSNNHQVNNYEARDENVVEESIEIETNNKTTHNFSEDQNENNQIDELRVELEKSLGFEMFKKVYKTVENKTDPLLLKCDFEVLKDILSTELSTEYEKKRIDSAIEKIPEVFAIVVKERISNIK